MMAGDGANAALGCRPRRAPADYVYVDAAQLAGVLSVSPALDGRYVRDAAGLYRRDCRTSRCSAPIAAGLSACGCAGSART